MGHHEIEALDAAMHYVLVLFTEDILPDLCGSDVGDELMAKAKVVHEALPRLEVEEGVVVSVVEEPFHPSAVGAAHSRKDLVPRGGDALQLAHKSMVGQVAAREPGIGAAGVEHLQRPAQVAAARVVRDVYVGDDTELQHRLAGRRRRFPRIRRNRRRRRSERAGRHQELTPVHAL